MAAAASAANAAFPRSAQPSPGVTNFQVATQKEHEIKTERSKLELFSKQKYLGRLLSTNYMGSFNPSGLSNIVNHSVTSLIKPTNSGLSSIMLTIIHPLQYFVPGRSKLLMGKKKHIIISCHGRRTCSWTELTIMFARRPISLIFSGSMNLADLHRFTPFRQLPQTLQLRLSPSQLAAVLSEGRSKKRALLQFSQSLRKG